MQNAGEQTKSIMVFLKVANSIKLKSLEASRSKTGRVLLTAQHLFLDHLHKSAMARSPLLHNEILQT